MRRGNGTIRIGVACALLFASLSVVVWRQSRALEAWSAVETAKRERASLQAERASLQREIQQLESRARVVAAAGERLGLRVPAATEIVILQSAGFASAPENADAPTVLSAAERR